MLVSKSRVFWSWESLGLKAGFYVFVSFLVLALFFIGLSLMSPAFENVLKQVLFCLEQVVSISIAQNTLFLKLQNWPAWQKLIFYKSEVQCTEVLNFLVSILPFLLNQICTNILSSLSLTHLATHFVSSNALQSLWNLPTKS